MTPQDAFARAADLVRHGQLEDAESACRAILASSPAHGGARYLLGAIALQRGQFALAESEIAAALTINPNVAQAQRDRGIALGNLGRFAEALASLDRAIALKADNAGAHNKRGAVLRELKRPQEALAAYDRAIALQPRFAEAFYNRGVALQDLGRAAEAAEAYGRAVALTPDFADAHNNLGNALKDLDRLDDALAAYERACAARPDFAEAHYNRGVLLLDLKRPGESLAAYDRAIALKSDYAEAHFSRGLCKLAMGRVPEAWDEFEWRFRVANYPGLPPLAGVASWMGEDLRGRSLLIRSEQGIGDIVHFARYVPELARLGAAVSFEAPGKLLRLLSGLPGGVRLVPDVPPDERFDFQCALMSLPRRLKADFVSIPVPIPYLSAEPERVAAWKDRIGSQGFKIGIAWQGARWHGGAAIAGRSIPLEAFAPLAAMPSVRLISLQKNEGVEQLASLPTGMTVETLGEDFDSGPDAFADTVAVMEHLDLVVSCDTSIAHVAGARGRPTWLALKHVPEWRWGLEGDRTPWYPTLRLFRQKSRGDWNGVFAEMASALRERLNR